MGRLIMDRYETGERVVSEATFDTSQFSDVNVHLMIMQHRNAAGVGSFWHSIGQGGSITAKALVSGGTVFIGSCDHNLYALTMEGKEKWRFSTKGPIQEGAVADERTVYIGSKDSVLYALDKETGEERWRFPTRGPITESPTLHKGRIYLPSDDQTLYCIDAKTGREIWRFKGIAIIAAKPLIVNNKIYFGYEDKNFYCLSLEGKLLWKFQTQGLVGAWPAAFWQGKVYFGNFDKNMYCLDAESGKLLWKKQFKAEVMAPYLWEGKLYAGCWDKNIYCLDAKTGEILWSFQTKDIATSYFEVKEGVCYAASFDHNVYAIDARTGKGKWRHETNGMVMQIVTFGRRVFAGSWDCNLYCFDLEGRLLWKFCSSLGSPSQIAPPETSYVTTAQLIIPEEEVQKEKDRYQLQALGGAESEYKVKSDYIVTHKYTKKRKVKSMSSGWED